MKEYEGLEWWDAPTHRKAFIHELRMWLRYWGRA